MTDKLQTVIFLVRHGLTDRLYSSDRTVDGERVLTEQGRAQMKKVGEYLASFAPVAIYASPTTRTKQSAEAIKHAAKIPGAVVERQELFEIYSSADYQALATRIPELFQELIRKHPGHHLVCVAHQDTIQGGLDSFDLTDEEKDFPCRMAEMYRLVFADVTLVECQKLKPAEA